MSVVTELLDDIDTTELIKISGTLLYDMLKQKTKFPLHRAVKLGREDVVIMYLYECVLHSRPFSYTRGVRQT